MKVVIPGGSGFLGQALSKALLQDGHEVVVLTRSLQPGVVVYEPDTGLPGLTNAGWLPDGTDGTGYWARLLDGADAVVNLAGESIAARRWSTAQKARIRDSRVLATRSVVSAIRAATAPPATLVNASAIGYYGDRVDRKVTTWRQLSGQELPRLGSRSARGGSRGQPTGHPANRDCA